MYDTIGTGISRMFTSCNCNQLLFVLVLLQNEITKFNDNIKSKKNRVLAARNNHRG